MPANANPADVLRQLVKAERRGAVRAGVSTCIRCSKAEHAGDCAKPRPLRKEWLQQFAAKPKKAVSPDPGAAVTLRLCEALSAAKVGGAMPAALAQLLKGGKLDVPLKSTLAKALRESFPDPYDPFWTYVRVVKAGGAAGGAPAAASTSAPGAPVATSTTASVGGPKQPKPKKPPTIAPVQAAREKTFGVNTAAAAPPPRASRTRSTL